MQPQIQYAKTEDGVSIAYWTMGEGPPLVIIPNLGGGSGQLLFDFPGITPFWTRLSQRLQLISFDNRGTGMSQRDVADLSPPAAARDLQAVLDRLGLSKVALYAHVLSGQMPLHYAAEHPERVTSMVYWVGQTYRRSREITRRLEIIDHLMEDEWDLHVDFRSHVIFGWDSPMARPYAEALRAGHTPESYRQALQAIQEIAQPELLARIHAPTLIAHLSGSDWPRNVARNLASNIPSANVIAIPGAPETMMPFLYDNEVLTTAIADFVDAAWQDPTGVIQAPELDFGAMRAILWTDLESHSAMMESLGDAKGREVLREHERITREALSAYGGTEVKAMGDGFMAWFPSAQRALECGIALQRSIASANAGAPLSVRIGVNAGEPIADEDPDGRTDLFGASVIAAARICSEASGGEIVVSDVVRQLLAGKQFLFADRRAVAPQGFEGAVTPY